MSGECSEGSIRLQDTFTNTTAVLYGRLEVCYNERWGTVCDTGFSKVNADVTCRQLGFIEGGYAYPNPINSSSSDGTPIWLDEIMCNGSEMTLLDCENILNDTDCEHYDDVWIRCIEGQSCDYKL